MNQTELEYNEIRSLQQKKATRGVWLGLGIAALAGGATTYLLLRQTTTKADEPVKLTASISMMRSAEEIYTFWRQLENLPRFMRHLERVTQQSETRSHWVARGPADIEISWDAEITEDVPNARIAWRAVPGSMLPNSGVVVFEDLGDGRGTTVRVEMEYEPPAGHLGIKLAKLIGQDPKQQINSDLRKLQQVLETGDAISTEGQPAGANQAKLHHPSQGNNAAGQSSASSSV